ncbi:MAG: AhpC/TSA family protein [Gemmataceae bacterium]|nr:AhpC/TSA family protein [Gemmataceae bacterium]
MLIATCSEVAINGDCVMRLRVDDILSPRVWQTVTGVEVAVPDPERLVHIQFRRWVGCPICNTHVGQLVRRANEIRAAGVREVLFFHSRAEDIRAFQRDVPFDLIADPTKVVYREFGVETSLLYWLSLRTMIAAFRSVIRRKFNLRMTGGPFGLPADVLVEPNGRIRAVKYGVRAYDQWSVDELLALAGRHHAAPTAA